MKTSEPINQIIIKKEKSRIETLSQYLVLFFTSMFLATQANASAFTKLTALFLAWKIEFYAFLAVAAFMYVMWDVIKVFAKKAEWGDVGKSLVEVGAAGAILIAIEFAWNMFM